MSQTAPIKVFLLMAVRMLEKSIYLSARLAKHHWGRVCGCGVPFFLLGCETEANTSSQFLSYAGQNTSPSPL